MKKQIIFSKLSDTSPEILLPLLKRLLFYIIISLLVARNNCYAQESNQYNLSIYNGLPSNLINDLTVDHYGYLWIPMDKGVARYNGYEVKTFDLSKGFVHRDIWRLFEDKKGRMWLNNVSDKIGYIYKDEYHEVVYTGEDGTFYPKTFFKDYADGIYFLSGFTSKNDKRKILVCREKKDTLQTYDVTRYGELSKTVNDSQLVTIDNNKEIYLVSFLRKHPVRKLVGVLQAPEDNKMEWSNFLSELPSSHTFWFEQWLISYNLNDNFIKTIDADNHLYKKVFLSDLSASAASETIKMIHPEDKVMNIITDGHIYKVNSNFDLVESHELDSVFNRKKEDKISRFINNPFWGKVIATFNSGVYFAFEKDTIFQKIPGFDLTNFEFIGNSSDSICFWWNDQTKTLVKIEKNKQIWSKYLPIDNLVKAIPYKKDTCILLSANHIYKLDINSMGLSIFYDWSGSDGVYVDNELYVVSMFNGFCKFNMNDRTAAPQIIDNDGFRKILYNSGKNYFLLYKNSKIFLYKTDHPSVLLDSKKLDSIGLNNIEKILVDNKYDNVFIHEGERLLMYNGLKQPYQGLFNNYIFSDALIYLKNDILVVAGSFGILFSKVTGPATMSDPVVYKNVKKLKYTIVKDIQISDGKVMLSTDKGAYFVRMPADNEFGRGKKSDFSYRFIVAYNGNMYDLAKHDTVKINQKNPKLIFDIINPTGEGKVKYSYRMGQKDSSWQELNSNELSFPKLRPSRYYDVYVVAYDNQWVSEEKKMHIYVLPYWYQRPLGRALVWNTAFVVLMLIIFIVVVITRRNVIKKVSKRNQKLELELKSVYSQINPHFIFNSLGAAMYLVKTKRLDDAYMHIYKFSQLLRAYIKSSRNRFITLNEEIKNLGNYVELQQTRFKDKFDFEMIVDPELDTGIDLPSLLLQPIVENAIIHGLMHKEDKGLLKIEFQKQEPNGILCIIDDNGIGREQSKLIKDENTIKDESYGSELVKDLIDILNKYEKLKIELEYIDQQKPLTGTIVKLSIKNLS